MSRPVWHSILIPLGAPSAGAAYDGEMSYDHHDYYDKDGLFQLRQLGGGCRDVPIVRNPGADQPVASARSWPGSPAPYHPRTESPELLPHESSEAAVLARGLVGWARHARYRRTEGLTPKFIHNTAVMLQGEVAKAAPLRGRWRNYHLTKALSLTSEVRDFLLEVGPVDADKVFPLTLRLYKLLEQMRTSS